MTPLTWVEEEYKSSSRWSLVLLLRVHNSRSVATVRPIRSAEEQLPYLEKLCRKLQNFFLLYGDGMNVQYSLSCSAPFVYAEHLQHYRNRNFTASL